MKLAPGIRVAIPLDRMVPENGLDRRSQRLARDVPRGEQVVAGLLTHHQPQALEPVEKLVEPQWTRAGRVGEIRQRHRSGVEPRDHADVARRLHQIEGFLGVEQHAQQRPRAHDARARRTSSSMKRSTSSSVL